MPSASSCLRASHSVRSASVEFEAAFDRCAVVLQGTLYVIARSLTGQGDLAAAYRFEDEAVLLDGSIGVGGIAPEFEEADLPLQCTNVGDRVDQEDVVGCLGERG